MQRALGYVDPEPDDTAREAALDALESMSDAMSSGTDGGADGRERAATEVRDRVDRDAGGPARTIMTLQVNGEPKAVPAACTVSGLLSILGMQGGRVAVAVNRSVILRSERAEHALCEGDRVEILEAVGGG